MIEAYCDGSITRNPGGKCSGGVVINGIGQTFHIADENASNSNWNSEYGAFLKCLEMLLPQHEKEIVIYSDLQQLVRHMQPHPANRKKIMKYFGSKSYHSIAKECFDLLPYFSHLSVKWIPREMNLADKWSK